MKYAGFVRKTFSGKLRVGVKLGFAEGNRYWPFGSVAVNNAYATGSILSVPVAPGAFGATTGFTAPQPLMAMTFANAAGLRSSVSPAGTAVREVPISRSDVWVCW